MKKIKLTKEQMQQIAAGILMTGLFAYAYTTYFYKPKMASIKKTTEEIQALTTRLEELKKRAARKDRLMAEIAAAERRWEDLKARLPEGRQLPQILQTITKIAQRHRMEITRLEPKPVVSADLYNEIPFGVTFSGSYHDLVLFLTEIGSLERLYHARDMVLSPAAATQTNPATSVSATLTLVTFEYRGG